MKKVMIFGSTGSVGKSALDVLRAQRKQFKVHGLCAYRDIKTLSSQIEEFLPKYVCVVDEGQAQRLKERINTKVKILKGSPGLEEFSHLESDVSLMAISGISCLKPLFTNIQYTKRVALANKESIVAAGDFLFSHAKRHTTEIIPVDSEINALFQLFKMKDDHLHKVYLTASGGALSNCRKKSLKNIQAKDVLAHPTWRMGRRITVDSATLVNKGFEVVETHHFFDVPYENIDIILHRQSMIHALVEFKDKTLFACLYPPDMRIPISFALRYPLRVPHFQGIDFTKEFFLSFKPLNHAQYPLFQIVGEAAKRKDNALAILNACDEVAVDYFLKGKIKFTDLYRAMGYMFEHYPSKKIKSIEDVFYWDNWAREKIQQYLKTLC
ncbi:MAG: 1-deoxy-D-xylulose-5-phosphate reductoisomerase [Candidatus Omnitrophota bacterium]|nr:MAG: 1-deoxy-D-xylulose-5-phosphate reductoisomerase [Candidatus Omnitrophota bacterium]